MAEAGGDSVANQDFFEVRENHPCETAHELFPATLVRLNFPANEMPSFLRCPSEILRDLIT